MITADGPPAPEAYPVALGAALAAARRPPCGRRPRWSPPRARRADVVYTTGMFGRSSLGALARPDRPLVVKLTADPAYERARRWGLWRGSLEEFQTATRRRDRTAPPRARRSTPAGRRTS